MLQQVNLNDTYGEIQEMEGKERKIFNFMHQLKLRIQQGLKASNYHVHPTHSKENTDLPGRLFSDLQRLLKVYPVKFVPEKAQEQENTGSTTYKKPLKCGATASHCCSL